MRAEKYAVMVGDWIHAANNSRADAETIASEIGYLQPYIVEQSTERIVPRQTFLPKGWRNASTLSPKLAGSTPSPASALLKF